MSSATWLGPARLPLRKYQLSRSRSAITRRSLVVGSLIAGLVLAAASLTYATPFIFFRDG